MKTKIALTCLTFSFAMTSFAQQSKEYFVSVDMTTGNYTIINELPGVNYIKLQPSVSTYDSNNERFFFGGLDFAGVWRLYTVNAQNGAILSNPPVAELGLTGPQLGWLVYNNADNTLYGILNNSASYQLVTINIATGTYSLIGSPFAWSANYLQSKTEFIDQANNEFCVMSNNGTHYNLNKINLGTGALSIVTVPLSINVSTVRCCVYSPQTGLIMAIFSDDTNIPPTYDVVAIDKNTGAVNTILAFNTGSCPDDFTSNVYSFNENTNQFTFASNNSFAGAPWDTLVTLDCTTNQVIHKAPFTWYEAANDSNILELEYSQSIGILYGLHWGSHNFTGFNVLHDSSGIHVFFDATSGFLQIRNLHKLALQKVHIFNAQGQLVYDIKNASNSEIHLSFLKPAVYFYSVQTSRGIVNGKFLKF